MTLVTYKYESRIAQQVDLRCCNNAGSHSCTIETNAVHSDNISDTTFQETVFVGFYGSGGESRFVIFCSVAEY